MCYSDALGWLFEIDDFDRINQDVVGVEDLERSKPSGWLL